MLTVQDDWIQYEATPVRRVAVRGGAACAVRVPVLSSRVRPDPGRPSTAPVRLRPAPAPRTRLRLTARGRVVLVLLPLVALLCGGSVLMAGTGAQADPGAPVPVRHVVVAPGESLWSVAVRVAPRRDPRDVVAALERLNGLSGAAVPAGAVLVVPAADAG